MESRENTTVEEARDKFYRGEFNSLKKYSNVYPCTQSFYGLEITALYVVKKSLPGKGKMEITPVGGIMYNGPVQGQVKPVRGYLEDMRVTYIQDVNIDGIVNNTLGIQMYRECALEMIDSNQIRGKITPKVM